MTNKNELIGRMESNLLAAERQRQTDQDVMRHQTAELQRRERESASCQELIKALTDVRRFRGGRDWGGTR